MLSEIKPTMLIKYYGVVLKNLMLVKELTNIQGGTPIEGLCNWRIGG